VHAALPTPFAVGPVNCYVLPEWPVTVVDPGMYFPESLRTLDELLASVGRRVGDIDAIVVTHGHPDHFGAAAHVARESGAPIFTGRSEARKLCLERDRFAGYAEVLKILGLPPTARELFPALMAHVGDMVQPADPSMIATVDDGDRLELGGRAVTAHVTPGHAAGHLSLFDGATLLSGDHLLPRISPNPFIELAEGAAPTRRHSLVEYLDSLDRFVALQPAAVLPGHGEPFHDVALWAARVREHHEQRSAMLHDLVRREPGSTVYELAMRVFPDLEGFTVILGVSEIAGHLDVLHAAGAVHPDLDVPERWFAGS
jgi:glyoxylase-like metal-dependent hydrolase (beta-lactamase superfamily II)